MCGKQDGWVTIAWHMDDLKVSHMDESMIEKFLQDIKQELGKETPSIISHGKVHNYHRMTLDFMEPGHVVIEMSVYVNTMLNDAPNNMDGKLLTPVASHLLS